MPPCFEKPPSPCQYLSRAVKDLKASKKLSLEDSIVRMHPERHQDYRGYVYIYATFIGSISFVLFLVVHGSEKPGAFCFTRCSALTYLDYCAPLSVLPFWNPKGARIQWS